MLYETYLISGIGESCFNDDDCKIDPEISDISPQCTDKTCLCPDNTYPAAFNTICQARDVGKYIVTLKNQILVFK